MIPCFLSKVFSFLSTSSSPFCQHHLLWPRHPHSNSKRHSLNQCHSSRHFYFTQLPHLWNSLPPVSTLGLNLHVATSIWSAFIKFFWSHSDSHFDSTNHSSTYCLWFCVSMFFCKKREGGMKNIDSFFSSYCCQSLFLYRFHSSSKKCLL